MLNVEHYSLLFSVLSLSFGHSHNRLALLLPLLLLLRGCVTVRRWKWGVFVLSLDIFEFSVFLVSRLLEKNKNKRRGDTPTQKIFAFSYFCKTLTFSARREF